MTGPLVPPGHLFGLDTLPYGSFRRGDDARPRVGVAIGDSVLDLGAAAADLLPGRAGLFQQGDLGGLLGAGPRVWAEVRSAVREWLGAPELDERVRAALHPARDVTMLLPFAVADYVDFYSSKDHASNVGRIFRPDSPPLPPNWTSLPSGYHGRAGTVVPSGTPIVRPRGQRRTPEGEVVFGASTRLDVEAELGFVVGTPSALGTPVPMAGFAGHVFGVCLVNDWSARDIQAWETVPLGPFLGKSFATSISSWVVPLAALDAARVRPPARDPRPLPYLDDTGLEPWGLDLAFELRVNGDVVSRPPFATTYWTGPQQLAHMTVNGACLRTGDLFASGTVSGPEKGQRGCLLELTWGGAEPFRLSDGTSRTFLEDGDEVVIAATAPGPAGGRLGLGEVRGVVVASR
jgi:fumarylacetoacetase